MKKFLFAFLTLSPFALAQFGGPPAPLAQTKASAPWDLTGTWVALVTEDWRFRMVVPPKGDYPGVPLNPEGRKMAEAFDASKVTDPCVFYGAAAIMRVPTRIRISWTDDATLKLETDAGMQTRTFHFGEGKGSGSSLQGYSAANWVAAVNAGRGPRKAASLRVVTTNMTAGYLRKNGVPYSSDAQVVEFYDVLLDPNTTKGEQFLMVKTIVNDPKYFTEPFITSTHFRKQADNAGWNPTACSAK